MDSISNPVCTRADCNITIDTELGLSVAEDDSEPTLLDQHACLLADATGPASDVAGPSASAAKAYGRKARQ